MSADAICLLALLCGAVGPGLVLSAQGTKVARFVGLQVLTAAMIPAMLLFAQIGESYELILPLALVPLSFAGAMVFIRLLGAGGSRRAR